MPLFRSRILSYRYLRSSLAQIFGSALIWKISLRTFAALCVLCGKETFKTINRKERQERKVHAKT
jgi:hypothetical protein